MKLLETMHRVTLATLLVLALSACNNKDNHDTNTTGQTAGTTQGGGEDGVANTGTGGNAGGTTGVSGTESTGTSTQTNTSNEESNANTETSNIVDVTPPVITLNGEANITLEQNENYIEEGATAQDAVDGNVSVSISGNVDTATVGSYTVTYTAQDSAGNEASVSREVVVESKYKILITRKEGNTAKYGRSAYFTISLSHKPTHPVEIYVESDNSNEGIVPKKESWGWDMKTGRIVIHPKDWKRGEQIVIQGRNKNVINGKQDYHIVTSPAVSDDPHFNGVYAEDVWMRGEVLELSKPDLTHIAFVPGLESRFDIRYKYNSGDYDNLKITLIKGPKGMKIEDGQAVWIPKTSDNGKHYEVEIAITNGKISSTVSFEIAVVTLGDVLPTVIEGSSLVIPSTNSCDFSGKKGKFSINLPDKAKHLLKEIKIREVINHHIPLPYKSTALSCMFYIETPDEMKILLNDRQEFKIEVEIPRYTTDIYHFLSNTKLYKYKTGYYSTVRHRVTWSWDDSMRQSKTNLFGIEYDTDMVNLQGMGKIDGIYMIGEHEVSTKKVIVPQSKVLKKKYQQSKGFSDERLCKPKLLEINSTFSLVPTVLSGNA